MDSGIEAGRSRAIWCHLSAFAGLMVIIPFANVLGPLVAWQTAPVKTAEVDGAGKEAVNFQITMSAIAIAVYLVSLIVNLVMALAVQRTSAAAYVMVAISIVEMIAYVAIVVLWLVYVITAGVRASQGVEYRYPIAFRLLR
jgi:uncharacterized Tic20 family protein